MELRMSSPAKSISPNTSTAKLSLRTTNVSDLLGPHNAEGGSNVVINCTDMKYVGIRPAYYNKLSRRGLAR